MLDICVVHGSLEEASEPVAVGHYQGLPIEGAEGVLDRFLGGRLTDRLMLGTYAEQEGGAILVPAGPSGRPPGGLVLGLGPAGEVTAAKVSRAMAHATLLRAVAAAEREPSAPQGDGPSQPSAGPRPAGVSAVLVGSNPLDGMSVEESLAALLDGVVTAIRLLQSNPRLRAAVRVGTFEVIEAYAERAAAAQQALERLARLAASPGPEVELRPAPTISERAGGKPGQPSADYNSQAWWRVDIRSVPVPPDLGEGFRGLEFTSIARRARADRLVQRLEAPTVNGLVAEAVLNPRPDPQLCNTLFELLMPNELKYDLFSADNLQLLLDPDSAEYPWEALAGRDAQGELEPLALRAGLLRQFSEPETRNARFSVRRPAGRQALVIGNPPAGDGAPDLPGARDEAERVIASLSQPGGDDSGYTVHALVFGGEGTKAVGLPDADAGKSWVHILNALYRHEYRIIHIAAHGIFKPDDPLHSGVVIGPNHCLTAQTINQLPTVPELVFLNCCHTGRIGGTEEGGTVATPNANLLAASISRRLISIGVRAVVAAGWAVEDEPASAFSTTLYHQMLVEGAGFGDAVRETRRAVRGLSDSLTWAAYQCYGDPEFRLRAPSSG